MFDKYINDNRNISISGYDSKFPKKKFNTEAGSLVLIFRHHLMRNFITFHLQLWKDRRFKLYV